MKYLIFLLILPLAACFEPEVEVTKPQDAKALVESLVYVKANNGLCFGVTTTSRISTNATMALNNLIVHVPCTN